MKTIIYQSNIKCIIIDEQDNYNERISKNLREPLYA